MRALLAAVGFALVGTWMYVSLATETSPHSEVSVGEPTVYRVWVRVAWERPAPAPTETPVALKDDPFCLPGSDPLVGTPGMCAVVDSGEVCWFVPERQPVEPGACLDAYRGR